MNERASVGQAQETKGGPTSSCPPTYEESPGPDHFLSVCVRLLGCQDVSVLVRISLVHSATPPEADGVGIDRHRTGSR